MIKISNVINRAVGGAISGGINGAINGALNGVIGGVLGSVFSGFGNLFGGGSGGTVVTLGFKSGHPYSGYPGILAPLAQTRGVAWPFRPSLEIARSVNYETSTPTHSMQDFRSFRHNSSANVTISGAFTAQTLEEGRYMQAALHFFRVATLMSFGTGGAVRPGMPPPVLSLNAYGPNNINNLPVVLDTMINPYPSDVDFINVDGNEVPTMMTITATMTVMLAPEQLRYFNLDAFAAGQMQNFI